MSDTHQSTALSASDLDALITRYQAMSLEARVDALYQDFARDTVMLTSAFAATSAMLLHLFATHAPWQEVLFIDTGFHFPETLAYKEDLRRKLGITVRDVKADPDLHEYTRREQTYQKDPDFCCNVNKVMPMEDLKKDYRVWVSGLMRWQTPHRSELSLFQQQADIIKFYPLIDVSPEQRAAYIKTHQLPFHPLVDKGYHSIGCSHCTVPGSEREGRWNNMPKTECGLHL